MTFPNIINPTDDKRVFESAKLITISKNSVKFGSSVYQFKNITGFKVGEIPKTRLSWSTVIGLIIVGLVIINFNKLVGIGLLALAIFLLYKHFTQIQYYGLIIYFNSGQSHIFTSKDKSFLMDIVNPLYDLMETSQEGTIHIDMSNRSVNVEGDLQGNAVAGDGSHIN